MRTKIFILTSLIFLSLFAHTEAFHGGSSNSSSNSGGGVGYDSRTGGPGSISSFSPGSLGGNARNDGTQGPPSGRSVPAGNNGPTGPNRGGENGNNRESGGGAGNGTVDGGSCPSGYVWDPFAYKSSNERGNCVYQPCSATTCTSGPNICGQTRSVTNSCGQCSTPSAPPNPPVRLCGSSYTNICGMHNASATWQCNQQTECPPQIPGNHLCPLELELYTDPPIVRAGERSNIFWETDPRVTASCALTGSSNGDNWTGISGNEMTSPIPVETTYTLSCIGLFPDPSGTPTTEELSEVIRILPSIDEN